MDLEVHVVLNVDMTRSMVELADQMEGMELVVELAELMVMDKALLPVHGDHLLEHCILAVVEEVEADKVLVHRMCALEEVEDLVGVVKVEMEEDMQMMELADQQTQVEQEAEAEHRAKIHHMQEVVEMVVLE